MFNKKGVIKIITYNLEEFEELKKTNNKVLLKDELGRVVGEFQRTEYTWFYDYFKGYRIRYMKDCIIDLMIDFEKESLIITSETVIKTKLDGKYLYLYFDKGDILFSSKFGYGADCKNINQLHYCDKEKLLKVVEKIVKKIEKSELKKEVKEMILEKYLLY